MNIRKNIDYTDMYAALDSAMGKNLSQVGLYYEIGKAVCQRTEKGAAVAAASYLSELYPDVQGFSPRNLRRMRDFYRTYEDCPDLLAVALQIGWTQNVVIMEADLSMELREWHLKATKQFGWSKAELIEKIDTNAHNIIDIANEEEVCFIRKQKAKKRSNSNLCKAIQFWRLIVKKQMADEFCEKPRRRWPIVIMFDIYGKAEQFYVVLKRLLLSKMLFPFYVLGPPIRNIGVYLFDDL